MTTNQVLTATNFVHTTINPKVTAKLIKENSSFLLAIVWLLISL